MVLFSSRVIISNWACLTVLYGSLLGLGLDPGYRRHHLPGAHRRMPYRKMLIFTGIMLGLVLLVMVGEEAFEMQQAGWLLRTTTIHLLVDPLYARLDRRLVFSLFPTVETIVAQGSPPFSWSAPISFRAK